jgi:hypothetical protein
MEAEIKAKEAEIKAAQAMKEQAPDRSAIEIKQMELNADAQQAAFSAEQSDLDRDIDIQKLALEQQKFELSKWQAQVDANMQTAGE